MGMEALQEALRAGNSRGRDSGEEVPEPERIAHEVRQRRLEESCQGRAPGDWARSYETWSDWVAEDAFQDQMKAQEERRAQEGARAQIAGCDHDHSVERRLMEKSTKEKLDECELFRLEGNAWFQEGQYMRASERYKKVLVWLDYTFPKTDEGTKRTESILLPALVNIAICFLKLRSFSECLQNAKRALGIDANNIKVLYCCAKASRELDDLKGSAEFLHKALAIDPDNFELCKESAMLKNKAQRYRDDSKLRAQAMFAEKSHDPISS